MGIKNYLITLPYKNLMSFSELLQQNKAAFTDVPCLGFCYSYVIIEFF